MLPTTARCMVAPRWLLLPHWKAPLYIGQGREYRNGRMQNGCAVIGELRVDVFLWLFGLFER